MSEAWFVHPEWAARVALATALIAALVLASWWRARRRAQRLLGTARWVGLGRLGRDLTVVLALAAIGLAVLGLRAGVRSERVSSSGVDVVLLVDVSQSMDVMDVPPSRLARARRIATELLARLGVGDRAALAAFASRGVLLTPLTPDLEALTELIAGLDGQLFAARGSDLDAGVRAALGAFETASERPRIVVVLSDGEDPTGTRDPGTAALARADTRGIAIALGLDADALVPDGRVPLRDADGRPVRSRRDAGRLARWAAATGGASFEADRWGEIDLGAAAAAIRRDAGRGPGDTFLRRVPAVQTRALAALAFALLWLEWTGAWRLARAERTGESRRGARNGPRRARAAAIVSVLVASGALAFRAAGAEAESALGADEAEPAARTVAQLESQLRSRPGDASLLIALGVARAQAGDRAGAEHALRAAALTARDPGLAALAWYDLGVLGIDAREFENARDAFFDALALRPDDIETRFNLEWTLRALRAEPPIPPPAERPDGEDPSGGESEPESPPGGDPEPAAAESARAPESDTAAPARPRFAPELGDDDVERWLARVDDAPAQALRAAARSDEEPRRGRKGAPAW
jgi:Ca-activated chloride channel family protein